MGCEGILNEAVLKYARVSQKNGGRKREKEPEKKEGKKTKKKADL